MWPLQCIILSANLILLVSSYTAEFNHGEIINDRGLSSIRASNKNAPESSHGSRQKRILLLTGNKSERDLAFSKLANTQNRIVKKINFLKSRRNQIYVTRGIPGVNYPIYHKVPRTNFRCSKQIHPGYYADVESGCQAFHICDPHDGRTDSLLCPNGTIFNQYLFTCDWWYNVDCTISPNLYHLNGAIMKQKALHSPKPTPAPIINPPFEYASASQHLIHLQPLRSPRPSPHLVRYTDDHAPQESNIKTVAYPSSSSLTTENSMYPKQKSTVNVQAATSPTHRGYQVHYRDSDSEPQTGKKHKEPSTDQSTAQQHLQRQLQAPKEQISQTESTTTFATAIPESTGKVEGAEDQVKHDKRQDKNENVGRNHKGDRERQFNRHQIQRGQTDSRLARDEQQHGGRDMGGDHFGFGPEPFQDMFAESQLGPPQYQMPPRYNFRSQRWGFNDFDNARFAQDGLYLFHV